MSAYFLGTAVAADGSVLLTPLGIVFTVTAVLSMENGIRAPWVSRRDRLLMLLAEDYVARTADLAQVVHGPALQALDSH